MRWVFHYARRERETVHEMDSTSWWISELSSTHTAQTYEMMVQFETCMVIEDQGDRSRFVESVYASRGQVGINPVGSGKMKLVYKSIS